MTYMHRLAADIQQRVPNDLVPDGDADRLWLLYALLARSKGTSVTAADVHDAWAIWMAEQEPGHRSLKPFDQLDRDTQAADEPYVAAIRAAAAASGEADA